MPAGNDGVGRGNYLLEGADANVRFAGPDKYAPRRVHMRVLTQSFKRRVK